MTVNNAKKIFDIVNNVMNYNFAIFGVNVTLWKLLAFSLLISIVLGVIYRLFEVN